jgi:hypothetical protein
MAFLSNFHGKRNFGSGQLMLKVDVFGVFDKMGLFLRFLIVQFGAVLVVFAYVWNRLAMNSGV